MTYAIMMLVGVPGSGKSTYAQELIKELEAENHTVAYISRDKIRFNALEPNDLYFDKEKAVFNEFIRQINQAIEDEFEYVIIDATHVSPVSRAKVLKRVRAPSYAALNIMVMDCSLETCIERNEKRTGIYKVPVSAIENMYKNFVYPTPEEFMQYDYELVQIYEIGEEESE